MPMRRENIGALAPTAVFAGLRALIRFARDRRRRIKEIR